MCFLIFLIFIGILGLIFSITAGYGLTAFICGVLLIVLSVIAFGIWGDTSVKKAEERARKRKQKEEEEYQAKTIYAGALENELSEYGIPDKRISIEVNNIEKEIVVWVESKKIRILNKVYSFSDILSCSVVDNAIVKKGNMKHTSHTSSNTGSAIGRAIVGGAIAGPVGAIIGGSTAGSETHTTTTQESDTIIHRYSINIEVNDFINPIVSIYIGGESKIHLINEIVALINVVINNK